LGQIEQRLFPAIAIWMALFTGLVFVFFPGEKIPISIRWAAVILGMSLTGALFLAYFLWLLRKNPVPVRVALIGPTGA
jgi:hypothetical protein